MHDVGEVNYNNHSHNNEGESEGAYMMESSALSTMYLLPESAMSNKTITRTLTVLHLQSASSCP